MATLQVFLTGLAASARPGGSRSHPKAHLIGEGGGIDLELPYAPHLVHQGAAPAFASPGRSGRKPLLRRTGGTLEVLTYELLLAYTDGQRTVEPLIEMLDNLADGQRVRWKNMGAREAGWWTITECSYSDTMRAFGSNAITRATASVTMTEVSDAPKGTGPANGGKKGKGKSKDSHKKGGGKKGDRHHRTKAGDTLVTLADAYYGDPNAWAGIADANGIRDPRRLAPGTMLLIPAP